MVGDWECSVLAGEVVTGKEWRVWDEFCVKGQHCDKLLFGRGRLIEADIYYLILRGVN